MSINVDKVPMMVETLPWQEIEGSILLLQPSEKFAHELNEVGAFVWKAIDGKTTVGQIIDRVIDEFEVERKEIEEDIDLFLSDLRDKKILA